MVKAKPDAKVHVGRTPPPGLTTPIAVPASRRNLSSPIHYESSPSRILDTDTEGRKEHSMPSPSVLPMSRQASSRNDDLTPVPGAFPRFRATGIPPVTPKGTDEEAHFPSDISVHTLPPGFGSPGPRHLEDNPSTPTPTCRRFRIGGAPIPKLVPPPSSPPECFPAKSIPRSSPYFNPELQWEPTTAQEAKAIERLYGIHLKKPDDSTIKTCQKCDIKMSQHEGKAVAIWVSGDQSDLMLCGRPGEPRVRDWFIVRSRVTASREHGFALEMLNEKGKPNGIYIGWIAGTESYLKIANMIAVPHVVVGQVLEIHRSIYHRDSKKNLLFKVGFSAANIVNDYRSYGDGPFERITFPAGDGPYKLDNRHPPGQPTTSTRFEKLYDDDDDFQNDGDNLKRKRPAHSGLHEQTSSSDPFAPFDESADNRNVLFRDNFRPHRPDSQEYLRKTMANAIINQEKDWEYELYDIFPELFTKSSDMEGPGFIPTEADPLPHLGHIQPPHPQAPPPSEVSGAPEAVFPEQVDSDASMGDNSSEGSNVLVGADLAFILGDSAHGSGSVAPSDALTAVPDEAPDEIQETQL
ncbi:hypothetical protein BJ508DRAFT_313391 [Ascobolus immersus RN42]|uniref:Uncharacterized protein n=1 Tax=Ascobolus immersus RN42 TaxID=1160509 RepID=A0A3N4HLU6_ASCIM|nr:hypothetical protein BJ508DRAFT_313391 [Ascobolus immersus RN42]